MDSQRQAPESKFMKFRKDITITIEGDIYDDTLSPEEIVKSLKWSWKHWWEENSKWIYGRPTEAIQGGRIEKIIFEGVELK